MRTVAEYIALMKHATGKPVPAVGHDYYATFNDAGHRLLTAHQWEWRTKGPVALPVAANSDTLDLPRDFGTLLNVWVPNTGIYTAVQVVSRESMGLLLAEGASVSIVGGTLYVCFNASTDTLHASTKPKALLYPTPTTAGSPTLQVIYARKWARVTAADDDSPVEIPEEFEDLLTLGARAAAWKRENGTSDFIDISDYAAQLEVMKQEDGLRQPSEGRITGGAGRFMSGASTDTPVGFATL